MLVVAAALTDGEGRVLLQRRPAGKPMAGLWEFPGGKVERGEAPEQALARELAEELGLDVRPDDCVPFAFASVTSAPRHLVLLLYRVAIWTGTPQPLAASAITWLAPSAMHDLPMPPADLPLVAALARACC